MNDSGGNRVATPGQVPATLIESAGWGVFFIWIGIALLAGVGWGAAILGVGCIMVGVQIARRMFALKVDRVGLVIGLCLAAGGLVRWLGIPLDHAPLPAWIVPALFVALGIAIFASAWMRARKG